MGWGEVGLVFGQGGSFTYGPKRNQQEDAPTVTRLPMCVGRSFLSLATCTTALSPMDVCSPTVILFTSPMCYMICIRGGWREIRLAYL